MFDKDIFIQNCIAARAEGQAAIHDVVSEAISHNSTIFSELGEPEHAGITPLYRSHELTILNFIWAPCMSLMPHNHNMPAVIGVYSGREDNIFWRKTNTVIEAAGAQSLGVGEAVTLGRNIIHSVYNPIGKLTCAIHVYAGDFFEPEEPRSEWDHETLIESPWNIDKVKLLFKEAQTRYDSI